MATGLRFPEGPVAMADGSVILGEVAGSAVTRIGRTAANRRSGQRAAGRMGSPAAPRSKKRQPRRRRELNSGYGHGL
jgi:gluconolactonase